jgi:hypothetical protein
MTRRLQSGILAALVLVFGYILYRYSHPAQVVSAVAGLPSFQPLSVENPALRTDLLDRVKAFEYQGSQRNIFSASLPPPPKSAPVAAPPPPAAPASPPTPPPLTIPATFFGFVTDARTGARRGFFSQGDEVYVLSVGEILMGRFRLLQLGPNTAELEEVASGRKTTLTLEPPGSS